MRAAGGRWLARLFWITLWFDILVGLIVVISVKITPVPQYELSDALLLLLSIFLLGGAMTVVAMYRHPAVHAIGLALAIALPLLYARLYPLDRPTPNDDALRAGHGYFRLAADQALADAIVAGDLAKAVSLVPAVNPNRVGWQDMTFMHLALNKGHEGVDPEIVGALLKAGFNPDRDSGMLLAFMSAGAQNADAAIVARNDRLLDALFAAGVDLNRLDQWGHPRFFHALDWPAGLARMLDHGVNIEAEDADGNTAIMRAVWDRDWRSIDVLLAHGARIDHVNHKGVNLRDMVSIAMTWDREPYPSLAALAERFR